VSTNGHKPRAWEPSRSFRHRRAEIAPHASRLSEILAGVRLELTLRAETSTGSARLRSGGGYWVHETEPAGDGAPALWIMYKVEPTRVIPTWIDLVDRDVPTDLKPDDLG
jgi:hypothetical protein